MARTRKAISVANLNNVSPRSVYAELVEASHFFLRPCVTPRRKVQPFDKLRVDGFGFGSITLRLDPDVIEGWRKGEPGWQSRMNAALREAMWAG